MPPVHQITWGLSWKANRYCVDYVSLAIAMLFGLMYALNLYYPLKLKYFFKVVQKVVMELDGTTLSKKAQVLENRLYVWAIAVDHFYSTAFIFIVFMLDFVQALMHLSCTTLLYVVYSFTCRMCSMLFIVGSCVLKCKFLYQHASQVYFPPLYLYSPLYYESHYYSSLSEPLSKRCQQWTFK